MRIVEGGCYVRRRAILNALNRQRRNGMLDRNSKRQMQLTDLTATFVECCNHGGDRRAHARCDVSGEWILMMMT